MEIKINREIKEYGESIFFGLSLRQLLCSILGILCSGLVFFFLKPVLGTEMTSWCCIVVATPFGLVGFLTYHGMKFEKLVVQCIKTFLLSGKTLFYKGECS